MPPLSRYLPLQGLTVTGVIDILVVAFLIYQALMVVRGTRAGHILVGILIMVVLYAVASWAGLDALRTLLSFIVPYLGLAVIVLFQSEIRRTLARLGRKRWFGLGSGFRAPEEVDEILLAVEQLAAKKVGALIVLERDIGLRTFIESGVPLDANLSYDLLITIFRPSAPLHDGAVIVQKGRIAAAACFLPLSMNPVLSTQYGTRHRAAIGITEETDAVSVVVSEETASISIAVGGSIERDITVEYLRERLSELLRRYVPTATLPTTVTDHELAGDGRQVERVAHEKDFADGAER